MLQPVVILFLSNLRHCIFPRFNRLERCTPLTILRNLHFFDHFFSAFYLKCKGLVRNLTCCNSFHLLCDYQITCFGRWIWEILSKRNVIEQVSIWQISICCRYCHKIKSSNILPCRNCIISIVISPFSSFIWQYRLHIRITLIKSRSCRIPIRTHWFRITDDNCHRVCSPVKNCPWFCQNILIKSPWFLTV